MQGSHSGPASTPPPLTAMKMKGLPFSVTRQEILNFYQGHNMIEESLKIGTMPDGKLTGEATIQFQAAEDCQGAQAALDSKHIGTRWVKLIRIMNEEYDNFENEQTSKYGGGGGDYYGSRRGGYDGGYGGRGGGRGRGGRGRGGRGGYNNRDDGGYHHNDRNDRGDRGDRRGGRDHRDDRDDRGDRGDRNDRGYGGGQTVRLSDFVNAENRYTCLKMRGLPFSVSQREIRDFFEDFRVAERDITIDLNQGRPTGYALVFFESEAEAERAKD